MNKTRFSRTVWPSFAIAGLMACSGGSGEREEGAAPQPAARPGDVRVVCAQDGITVHVDDPVRVTVGQDFEWRLVPPVPSGNPGANDIIEITPKDPDNWVFSNTIEGTRQQGNGAVGSDAQGTVQTYEYKIFAQCTRGNRPTLEVTLDPDLILEDPETPADSVRI